jgi:hypothetical protein
MLASRLRALCSDSGSEKPAPPSSTPATTTVISPSRPDERLRDAGSGRQLGRRQRGVMVEDRALERAEAVARLQADVVERPPRRLERSERLRLAIAAIEREASAGRAAARRPGCRGDQHACSASDDRPRGAPAPGRRRSAPRWRRGGRSPAPASSWAKLSYARILEWRAAPEPSASSSSSAACTGRPSASARRPLPARSSNRWRVEALRIELQRVAVRARDQQPVGARPPGRGRQARDLDVKRLLAACQPIGQLVVG